MPAAPFRIQLTANVPEKAEEDGQCACVREPEESPGFGSTQLQPRQPFGE